jgi:hypothetical protein
LLGELSVHREVRIVSALFLMCSPVFLAHQDQIFSDIPFLFFYFVYLFLALRAFDHPENLWVNLGLGFVGFLLIFTRSIGIIFPVLELIFALWVLIGGVKNVKKIALTISGFILCFVLYKLYSVMIHYDYGANEVHSLKVDDHLRTLKTNSGYYGGLVEQFITGKYISKLFLRVHSVIVYHLFVAAVFVFMFFDLVKNIVKGDISALAVKYRKELFIGICSLTYLAVILIWPYRQTSRFLFPVLPFLLVLIFRYLVFPDKSLIRAGLLSLFIFLMIADLVISVKDGIHDKKEEMQTGPFSKKALHMVGEVKALTRPEDTLVFYKARWMHLMTGRISVITDTTSNLRKYQVAVLKKGRDTENVAGLEHLYEDDEFVMVRLKH